MIDNIWANTAIGTAAIREYTAFGCLGHIADSWRRRKQAVITGNANPQMCHSYGPRHIADNHPTSPARFPW